jgi:hypothetical protein
VVLTGICALSPGSPPVPAPLAGPLLVVLPAARRQRFARSVAGAVIPAHFPFVIVRSALLQPGGRVPDSTLLDPDGVEMALCILERERITVDVPSQPLVYEVGTSPLGLQPATPAEELDARWVADMRRIWPAVSTLRSDCTAALASTRVGAQIVVPGGHAFSTFPQQHYMVSTFEPQRGPELVEQALTRVFVIELPIDDAVVSLQLSSQSLDDGTSLPPIVLDVPDEDVVIEVVFGNTTLDDAIAAATGVGVHNHNRIDTHYELYYQVYDAPDDEVWPVPVMPPMEGVHSNCPVTQGDP